MKVEQENFLPAILRSVQRRRRRSGTRVDMAWAKSALITSASNRSVPVAERTPVARRPSNRISCDRLGQLEGDAHLAGDPLHRRHHRAAAAARMVDAELVFHEREDGEQARAAERRHAEVFGLEREGEPHPVVAEIGGQVAVHGAVRAHQLERFQHARAHEIHGPVERGLQDRAERGELGPVVRHEAGQGQGILGGEAGHFLGEPGHVAGCLDLAAGLEDQMILRVEPDQVDLAVQIVAAGGEDVGQDAGIQEESGPHVEVEGAHLGRRGDGGGAAADGRMPFVDGDLRPGLGQQHRHR